MLTLAIAGILGLSGIVYSVTHPPTEPVVHCVDPVKLDTYHFLKGSCANHWVQYNEGDVDSALKLWMEENFYSRIR